MFLGLIFAIGACFIWGLIFVVPYFLSDFTLVEVVLGRYLTYGLLSSALFFRKGFGFLSRYSTKAWVMAFSFALISNLIYYLGLVAGLRWLSPTLTVLLVGLAPVGITFYGNWHAKELAFKQLTLPAVCMAFGLILVHASEIQFTSGSALDALIGLCGVLVALAAWVWYAVHNARFLKVNPQISGSEWATVIGVATLFWALLIGGFFAYYLPNEVSVVKLFNFSTASLRYLLGASILGMLCSWVGCFLWSQASVRLPIVLMGPLLVFEVLFGLFFVYLYKHSLPAWTEMAGVIGMVSGILMTLNSLRKKESATKQSN